ncbi:hypothetical protein ACLBKU_03755 [Erythrobacter sp. NE805]|uniref:hypothetical protein n=1 Tax=Erythrobacter sp. NE805 TaxID=3389875 RepID=UPI00396B0655
MLRPVIIAIILASLIATYVTRSFVAPGIGAALLFAVLLLGWLFNRSARGASVREAEAATHRQRAERARDSGADPH